jgi:hypothetical protein
MEQQWRDLEHTLSLKARTLKLDLLGATESDLPEARAMRVLMRKIKAAERRVDALVERISETRATVAEAALAKIELAIGVQGSHDWQAHVLALLQSGVADLRLLACATAP